MKQLLVLLVLLPIITTGQSRKQKKSLEAQKKIDQQIILNLEAYASTLSSTDCSAGVKEVASYIKEQFGRLNLLPPAGSESLQYFQPVQEKYFDTSTYLRINGNGLVLSEDFFPLAFSSSKKVNGMPAMALREKGVPWFINLNDWIKEDTSLSKEILLERVRNEANKVATKGATALFVYNSEDKGGGLSFQKDDTSLSSAVPVVFLTSKAYHHYFSDAADLLDIELNVDLKKTNRSGVNLVGYIDNDAASTVVLGTDYVCSRSSTDNTALLFELARMLNGSTAQKNNYLFIVSISSDTATPKGKYWINSPLIRANTSYVINLDKVNVNEQTREVLLLSDSITPSLSEILGLANKTNLKIEVAPNLQEVRHLISSSAPVITVTTSNGSKLPDLQEELNLAKLLYNFIEVTGDKGKLTYSKAF